ncbi:trichohyalin-like [Dreissena polymorpha]|uniref:trichohyalin-like n=1 Tax=Dreissena polymorpha TaxID=45954 RepID=UPI0022648F8F|nr:trichohyalin-like [Dreissena polymorpha]
METAAKREYITTQKKTHKKFKATNTGLAVDKDTRFLAASSDMETSFMKERLDFPERSQDQSVCCDDCETWVHYGCAGVTEETVESIDQFVKEKQTKEREKRQAERERREAELKVERERREAELQVQRERRELEDQRREAELQVEWERREFEAKMREIEHSRECNLNNFGTTQRLRTRDGSPDLFAESRGGSHTVIVRDSPDVQQVRLNRSDNEQRRQYTPAKQQSS